MQTGAVGYCSLSERRTMVKIMNMKLEGLNI
nr:MAG TPA: hypothetical protein [Bacteriophage sp.]